MTRRGSLPIRTHDVIVVGSGLAGLVTALALAPRSVTIITKTPRLESGSSPWAKGGIAAAVGPGDRPEYHAADTVSAGAGIGDPELALSMAAEGVEDLQWLINEGVPFDRGRDGGLALGREAAHRYPRIVHAGGDATGQVLMSSLIERVHQSTSISILESTFAYDLLMSDGEVQGLLTFSPQEGWVQQQSSTVVLATGGIGMAWWYTTNPGESTGDGLAMAARAGALLSDVEFMQFHPTALIVENGEGGTSLPLLSEALRGAGALLVDEAGNRFMTTEHPDAELAPRDITARAIQRRIERGERSYLDLRPVLKNGRQGIFPQAVSASRRAGIDPENEALPVIPAAHYHMGGIHIDGRGRSSLKGLWACGEVATTGIHGANRLASNSLLEALVYARRVADDIGKDPLRHSDRPLIVSKIPKIPTSNLRDELQEITNESRKLMTHFVGVLRSGKGLKTATSRLRTLDVRLNRLAASHQSTETTPSGITSCWGEARNLLLVARLVTLAALRREESRGAHYRDDYPKPKFQWRRRQSLTVDMLEEF